MIKPVAQASAVGLIANNDLKRLGKRIRKRRLQRGLTQDAMEGPGLSYKHYQDVERGVVNPAFSAYRRISHAPTKESALATTPWWHHGGAVTFCGSSSLTRY